MNLNEYSLFFLFLIPTAIFVAAWRSGRQPQQRRALALLGVLTFLAATPFVLLREQKPVDVATVRALLLQSGETSADANQPIFLEVYSDY